MKFIHISDLHLGAKIKKLTQDKSKIVREEELVLTNKLFEYAKNIDCQGIFIAGDLFDGKTISPKLKKSFFDAVKTSQIKTFYLRGNHDEDFFLSCLPENFFVLDEENNFYNFNTFTVSTGKTAQNFQDNLFHFHLLHGDIANPSSNDGIDLPNYKNLGINYLALGHIHSYSAAKLDEKTTYVYSGCLFPHGFDDLGEKGFVEIEVDEANNCSNRFVPFSRRNFVISNIDISGLEKYDQIKTKISQTLANIPPQNFVRACLVGTFTDETEKFLSQLEEDFKSKFFYFELVDNTKLKLNIKKLKEEKLSFKSEFLSLVEDDAFLSPEEKNQICQIGIEALRGDDFSI